MKELVYPYAYDLENFSGPVGILKDFFSFESEKVLFDRFYRHDTMNEEQSKTAKDCTVDTELKRFNDILMQHSEQSGNLHVDFSRSDISIVSTGSKINRMQPIAISNEPDSLLDQLHDKKINLVLVATSLDESDVVKKLKSTLDPAKASMIPLKFDTEKNSYEDNGILVNCRASNETYESKTAESSDVKFSGPKSPRRTNKNSGQEKDGKYWKRRSSNNEAAKKSRDARKARFEWMENRAKELDVENASLRKQLEDLTQEVLQKEKNGFGKYCK
jgi:hypothetical protein